jgi:hypothetical protein
VKRGGGVVGLLTEAFARKGAFPIDSPDFPEWGRGEGAQDLFTNWKGRQEGGGLKVRKGVLRD